MDHRAFCKYLAKSYNSTGKLLVVKTGVTLAERESIVNQNTFSVSIISEGPYYERYNPKNNTVVILMWLDCTTMEEFC